MQIVYEKSFIKQKDKLLKKNILTEKQINQTIDTFKENEYNSNLYNHKINCKYNKNRRSLAVLGSNQEYKILFSDYGDLKAFEHVMHHKKYDRVNKDC